MTSRKPTTDAARPKPRSTEKKREPRSVEEAVKYVIKTHRKGAQGAREALSRLTYLDEDDVHVMVEALTGRLFPESPAFQLAGAEGEHRLLAALAQPRWPHYRTAQAKAAVLHYGINKGHPYVDGATSASPSRRCSPSCISTTSYALPRTRN